MSGNTSSISTFCWKFAGRLLDRVKPHKSPCPSDGSRPN